MEDEEDKIEEAEHDAAEQNAKDSEKYEPPPRTLPPIGQVSFLDAGIVFCLPCTKSSTKH